jgi:ABC-2 type transport system permease protein
MLLGAAAKEESGILMVALAMEDPTDPIASAVADDLRKDNGLIRFLKTDTPKEAQALVEQGKVDAAWIFPERMQDKIDAFAVFPNERNGFVAVIQREDSVFLRLALEKLNAALYPYLSLAVCENYVYSKILTVSDLSKEQLKQYYDAVNAEGTDLFDFVYANSGEEANTEKANYLLSPVRGLLAIMVVLGGLAAVLFYRQDEASGVFDRLPRGKRFWFSAVYPAVAVGNVILAVFAALGLAGLLLNIGREIAALLLYGLITAGFCTGLRLLMPNGHMLAAVTPALIAGMTVLCPIFVNPPELPALQYLLPPFYYLKAIYDLKFMGYMAIYAVAICGVDWLLYRARSK